MQKLKRVIKTSILSIIIFFVVIISGSWVYHSIAMKKEIASTPAPGILIDVDGHSMHVYTEGDGEHTIVFLSGAGSNCIVCFGRHAVLNPRTQHWFFHNSCVNIF